MSTGWPPEGWTAGDVPWGLDARDYDRIEEQVYLVEPSRRGWLPTGKLAYRKRVEW